MTPSDGPDARPTPGSSLSAARRINAACERFEAAWRGGGRPRIEDALGAAAAGAERTDLLREILALELELRRGLGERPDLRAYQDRFPADARLVAEVFASLETEPAAPATTVAFTPASPATPAGSAQAIQEFGDYELLEEIARGGMGVVYRARQRSLKRTVAVKMILSGRFASASERERFCLEAELAANLNHPNIVPIYEIGEHAGHHYFSMRLIDGGSLSRRLAQFRDDPDAAARLLATVARAVDHAHRHGFLHCDLKPANILIDAEGQPHVTDFGLARRFDEGSSLTASSALMGTPCYMAPEQASGPRDALTPAADVYGLGAVFYELLTGQPPFRAPTVMETVVLVLEREPPPPRQVRAGIPPELETVCLKCLEKAPRDRYASAAELAASLERYLRGEDVPGNSLYRRLRRWTRREPELVSRLGGLALVMALTQFNFMNTPNPSVSLHTMVMTVLAVWALASVMYQVLLRRGWNVEAVRMAWAATDIALVTVLVKILDAVESTLLVGYPLLIAAAGLWSRAWLVWFATGLAELAYGLLYLDHWLRQGAAWRPAQYPNIFMAALAVTGFVVARQVKRIWALSHYYEQRPLA